MYIYRIGALYATGKWITCMQKKKQCYAIKSLDNPEQDHNASMK